MPDWLEPFVRWFYSDANGAALDRIIGVILLFGALIAFLVRTFKRQEITLIHKTEAKPEGFNEAPQPLIPAEPVLTLTLEQYRADLKTRETELRAELNAAHAQDKALLQAQIDELTRQQNNPEDAFEAFKARIAELEALLGNAETEDEQAAKAALEAGDLMEADEIFARISEAQKLNIKKAADAEYARGEIAEQQIRWKAALAHFTRASELEANFKTLRQHWDLLWKMGRYDEALPVGEKLEQAAIAEFGAKSHELAVALSCRAMIFKCLGEYAEAERLFREAMQIDKTTLGKDDPDYATSLNNLALLLGETGRYEEAEPLYREAMQITEATLGKDHPAYSTRLNNLAGLLQETGRHEEAEPLFREAMQVDEATLGRDHPAYATGLNNLAELLRETSRHEEAEPLYREAMQINEATLGKDHPDYARNLNNLAGLLQETGRHEEAEPLFREAVEVLSKSLGPDHPNTKAGRENLDILLKEMGKS